MTVFCSVCKRHVVVGDDADGMRRFREQGHDDTPVANLRRGPVGWYARRDQVEQTVVVLGAPEPDVEKAIVESFKNETRIAA